MSPLRNIYQVSDQKTFNAQYYDVQEKILGEYHLQLRGLIENNHAENIVFIVHGFNDENPISSYQLLEESIRSNPYGKKAKPVFVEIYWDGLTAGGKSPMLAKIWGRAQNNTKYVSLGMRTLLNHLSFKMPMTIITHSLGASVGTGALFNTTTKWRLYDDPDLNRELESLLKAPTRKDVRIRLGMLAPAIPGGNTFVDFNKRSPNISPAQNNIDKIVIGYNPYDFATSKAVLSGHLGTTTLGCNQGIKDVDKGEIPNLKDRLYELGYSRGQIAAMVRPVMFATEKWKLGLQEHGLKYYIRDKTSTEQFIRMLFE